MANLSVEMKLCEVIQSFHWNKLLGSIHTQRHPACQCLTIMSMSMDT